MCAIWDISFKLQVCLGKQLIIQNFQWQISRCKGSTPPPLQVQFSFVSFMQFSAKFMSNNKLMPLSHWRPSEKFSICHWFPYSYVNPSTISQISSSRINTKFVAVKSDHPTFPYSYISPQAPKHGIDLFMIRISILVSERKGCVKHILSQSNYFASSSAYCYEIKTLGKWQLGTNFTLKRTTASGLVKHRDEYFISAVYDNLKKGRKI